jgi:hypothetical protein
MCARPRVLSLLKPVPSARGRALFRREQSIKDIDVTRSVAAYLNAAFLDHAKKLLQ